MTKTLDTEIDTGGWVRIGRPAKRLQSLPEAMRRLHEAQAAYERALLQVEASADAHIAALSKYRESFEHLAAAQREVATLRGAA